MATTNTTTKPLTSLQVERHKSGYLADSHPYRGLRLVANKNGTKTWIYRYRAPDKRLRQIKLGNYPAMGLGAARDAYRTQKAIRDDASLGDPRAVQDKEKARVMREAEQAKKAAYLVSDLLEHYLIEHIERVRKRPLETRRMFEHDVFNTIGHLPVIEVRRHHIHELIQSIAARAPRIAQMVKTELNGAFEHAMSAGRIDRDFVNPTYGVKAPPQVRRKRAFTEAELAYFLEWLPKSKMSESIRDALMLMLLTGCRGGEVVAADWSHIDLERGEWFLPDTKNGLPHTIYLPTQAAEIFKSRQGLHEQWVFPSPKYKKKHIRQHAIVYEVEKKRNESKLAHWTGHDVRRSCATGMARLGCPRVVQDRILNHADTSVSGIYDRHTYDAEAREWWQKWADHLDGLKAPQVASIRS